MKMEDMARTYVTYARQLSAYGRYDKAFDYYVLAFDKCSHMKTLFEAEFRVVLIRLNEMLARFQKVDQIFANFGKAINTFPGNVYLLNDIGKYLYKFGYYTVAWCHFQNALKVDSGFVDAEKNLNSVKNLLVERWHFRMLNDSIRNEAYRAAIRETVKPDQDRVLDIGTGTGLLALYAYACEPYTTTGCEGSDVMAKIAQVIMHENLPALQARVNVVNKMSTNINCTEIGGKQSLVITEVFDSGLLGEHVLQSVSHAWENLMSDNGRIIPNSAEFFVIGAKCDHLHLKYQLRQSAKVLLNIPNMNVHTLSYGDTYDCTDVHLLKDITYITDAHSVFKVNFNSYDDIQGLLQQNEPISVPLKATRSGEVNIIVGWFNLHLTEDIMITTNPQSENKAVAWQQAVFVDFAPRNLEENEIFDTKFLINGGKLTLVSDHSSHVTRVSPETLRFLNDYDYTKKIKDCICMACVYFGQLVDISNIDIADLCPFPLFGLLMLQRGAKSLICIAKSPGDKKFFKKVLKANKISLSKVKFLLADEWTLDSFGKEKYHAIVCNGFELCGDIDLHHKEIAHHLKHHHLYPAGLFLPTNVYLMGQIVESPWLDRNNRVIDEDVNKYQIGSQLNKFQVSQNYCLDLTTLDFTELSAPHVLGTLNSSMVSSVIKVPIINNGNANAIVCWYKIEMVMDWGEVETNRSDSFIDGMAFLADPKVHMVRGDEAGVIRCVDCDGSFKLIIDLTN